MTSIARQDQAFVDPVKPRFRPVAQPGYPTRPNPAIGGPPQTDDAVLAGNPGRVGSAGVGSTPRAIDQTRYRGGMAGQAPQVPGARGQRPGSTRPQFGTPPVAPPVAPPPAPPVAPPVAAPIAAPAEDSLTDQAFVPGGDPRLDRAQTRSDNAMNAIFSGEDYSGRAGEGAERYRGVLGTGQVNVEGLDGMPNRTELAKQALADFEKQGEQGLQNRFRKVGQSAAKFGRIGMGDVNAELGSIQGDYERDLMAKRNELARGVSEGDIGDRFRSVELKTGVNERNQDRSFDRSRAAIDLGGRDADRDIAGAYDQLGAAGQLEDRVFGQGQQNRGEFRTERGYQQGRRQNTLDNAVRQREMQNAEMRERAIRAQMLMQQGGQVPDLESILRAG